MDSTLTTVIGAVLFVLAVVSRILLFRKAGRSGWLAVIPVVSLFTEFNICWKGGMVIPQALLAAVMVGCVAMGDEASMIIGAVAMVLFLLNHFTESLRLARAFGKGGFCGLLLFLFPQVARICLGLGTAEYVGKDHSFRRNTQYA